MFCCIVYAEEGTNRLEQAQEALEKDPDNPELIYKKVRAMLETLGPIFSLRTATTELLRAIELDPDNHEYKSFLGWLYYEEWYAKDFGLIESVEYSEVEKENLQELQALKDKAKAIVEEYAREIGKVLPE